jgi:membrane associated rhomboid family serine protease
VTSSGLQVETSNDETPVNLVEVGTYSTERDGFDHGLVSLTLGHPFWLVPSNESFQLLVEAGAAETVREQLSKYDRESVSWPPRPISPGSAHARIELLTPVLWCLLVLASFRAQAEWPGLTEAGAVDSQAILQRGEIWRAFTALFLHGDLGHLVSNLFSGLLVFSAVTTTIGRARGWCLVALAAVVGNLAAALAHYPESYRSLGASTAIFAALGILTGKSVRTMLGSDRRTRWRAMFTPLATGLTVLALYGAGGQQVDVLAHVTGFTAGFGVGFAAKTDGSKIG